MVMRFAAIGGARLLTSRLRIAPACHVRLARISLRQAFAFIRFRRDKPARPAFALPNVSLPGIRAWRESRPGLSSGYAASLGAGHLHCRGLFRRRAARALALLARAAFRPVRSQTRWRPVSSVPGPFLSDSCPGRRVAVAARAGREIVARNRPRSALRPVKKIVRRPVARLRLAGGGRGNCPVLRRAGADGRCFG